ncbi:DUF6355 family natural product biosynthesis protein [Nonomuraea indica]|uniref:DUF6355 family natural product biosynthesis protein n=1 Tax=Nonomuraea indica TaxID=1581193 RepID=A0ABW8AFJ8_9ACTN|nr:DUF6355 family natural product biosynthesis protein [Nonomuraea indica]
MLTVRRALGGLVLAGGVLAGSLAPALAAGAAQASSGPPSATASQDVGTMAAPVGKRCGAYLTGEAWGADLRYYHCGDTRIFVEIDNISGPNQYTCVDPWEDKYLAERQTADNAWYIGLC